MIRWHHKGLVVFGMIFAVIITVVCLYILWKSLVSREAKIFGKKFIHNMKEMVMEVDAETKKVFTTEFYDQVHKKPISKNEWMDSKIIKDYQKRIEKITHLSPIIVAFFTDCYPERSATCYADTDPKDTDNRGYDPKSRPWYLATRSHTDWVLLQFMLSGRTKFAGYPTVSSIILAKHILRDTREEAELKLKALNKEKFAIELENEKGLWLSIALVELPDSFEPKYYVSSRFLLKSLLPNEMENFENLDVSLRTMRFPKAMFQNNVPMKVSCDAITKIKFMQYSAIVACQVNEEPIQFFFNKSYGQPAHAVALGLAGSFLIFIFYRFFSHVYRLQQQNIQKTIDLEKGRLIPAIGAKLVHDLKKGIVTQLNSLEQEYNQDFDLESAQPDFKERLKERLKHHFKYLHMLNRYMNLLNNNLKQKKEGTWIVLSKEHFKDYVSWIMGVVVFEETHFETAGTFLKLMISADKEKPVELKISVDFPEFSVPEMSFYRILKNLWENYNTYGGGVFELSLTHSHGKIILETTNQIQGLTKSEEKSTQLGMMIIRQLLQDNFGKKSDMNWEKKDNRFFCKLTFPISDV